MFSVYRLKSSNCPDQSTLAESTPSPQPLDTDTSIPKESSDKASLEPPQPPIIPLYPEPNPIIGGELSLHVCRLCNNGRQSFRSDYDFDMHLTKIHYEERLMKRVRFPYKCQKCFYSPPDCLTTQEKEEDLLIHYGCNERLAVQYYQDECSKFESMEEPVTQEAQRASISCQMCNSSHDNERLFVRHITLRHFTKQVSSGIIRYRSCPHIFYIKSCH